MPISFVGSFAGTHAATTAQTVAFSNLRNASGVAPTLQQWDLVVVCVNNASTTNRPDGSLTPSGYTGIFTPNLYANDTNDANLQVSYKFMGATPDTSVAIPGSNATTAGVSYTIHVFRDVDRINPLDVTSTNATGTNTGVPNAPGITPVSTGAWTLHTGASAMATGTAPSTTPPTGMSTTTNHFRTAVLTTTTNDPGIATGIKTDWTSGTYDPAAFGGFTTTNTGSWAAASIALRPYVPITLAALSWSSGGSIPENSANGTVVGTLGNRTANSTLTLTNDASGRFTINSSTAQITVANGAALDYETNTSHSITVRETLTGATNTPRDTVLTVTITDVVEVTLQALSGTFTLPENANEGTIAGALTGTTSGSTLTLIDNSSNRVIISGTNIIKGTGVLDYETNTSHTFTVRETHPNGTNSPRDTVLTLNVTDVAEGAGFNATGGTYSEPGDGYKYWTFTSSGTLNVSSPGTVEYLIVGGGGAGGRGIANSGSAGGGGAGGVRTASYNFASTGSFTVTVGSAGIGDTIDTTNGQNGGDSSIVGVATAVGGGGGGSPNTTAPSGSNGGSGGGGVATGSSTTIPPGTGTVGQGYDGGIANTGTYRAGGGGGGAGSVGGAGDAASGTGGNGGTGVTIWGYTLSGGGAGAGGVAGGTATHGGGNAQRGGTSRNADIDATSYGGGGGAITSTNVFSSGNGYQGLVVIRTPVGGGSDTTAPVITSSNAINLAENTALNHTLTANESVTWTKTGGADQVLFTLSGNTLTLPAQNFEAPTDSDANNTYVVQVTATDTANNSTVQTITVTVTDVAEGGGGIQVPIMVGTATLSPPPNNAVRYSCLTGSSRTGSWASSTSYPGTPVAVAGVFNNLRVRLPAALTGSQSWTFTLIKNGVATGLTCTVTSSGLVASNTVNSVSVAPGDLVALESSPTNTPTTQTNIQFSLLFTSNGTSAPMFSSWNSMSTGEVAYGAPGSHNTGVQAIDSRNCNMPCSGSIKSLYFVCKNAPGTGETRVLKLLKNGADTGLSATISGTNTSANATFTVNYTEGDILKLVQTCSANAAASLSACSLEWEPTNSGQIPLFSPGNGTMDGTTVQYGQLSSNTDNNNSIESNAQEIAPVNFTILKYKASIRTAPGAGASRVFNLRKNNANIAGTTITLTGTDTVKELTVSQDITTGDMVGWIMSPTNNPVTSDEINTSTVIRVGSAPASTGKAKVNLNSVWIEKPFKVWTGSIWTDKPAKVWNGSSWVNA